jgi:hypothetical protein
MGLLLLFVAGQFIRSPSLESQRTIATSAVKCLKKLAPAFDPIEAAGKEGDVAKAKPEWEKGQSLVCSVSSRC